MRHITIVGDSWALGEWDSNTQHLLHPGTAEYLRAMGHRVTNLARGGDSNRSQVLAMEDPGDLIIWFLTDPIRDTVNGTIPGLDRVPTTWEAWHRSRGFLLDRAFDLMWSRAAGRPVWLVGGVEPVPAGVPRPGWRVVVQDWLRWLVPHTAVSTTHLNRNWRHAHSDPRLLEFHERAERGRSQHLARARRPGTLEHLYWWPDGVHPNREAHRRLAQERIGPMLAGE